MVEDKIEPAGKTIPVSGVAISRIVFISIIFAILSFPLFTGYAITRITGMAFHDSLKISGLLSACFVFFTFYFIGYFNIAREGF